MTSSNLTSNQLYDMVSNSGICAQKKKGNQGIEETQQSIGGGSGGVRGASAPQFGRMINNFLLFYHGQVNSLKLNLESSSKR